MRRHASVGAAAVAVAAAALLLDQNASAWSTPPSPPHHSARNLPSTSTTTTKKYNTFYRRRTSSALHLGDFFNFNKSEDDTKEAAAAAAAAAEKEKEKETNDFVDGAYDESDPVEKIFNFFFGEREEKPMGMDRFGPDRFPEQYPATKTEWAEPIPADTTPDMTTLRPFLKNTNLESRPLRLTYDANKDGWDPITFHAKVDKLGPGIVICTSKSGDVFGGYNPKGWVGYGEARGSIAAFLFLVGSQYGEVEGAPGLKLQKVGGKGLAQMDNPESGPSFGPDALVVPLEKDDPKLARSKLGSYYERMPDGGNSLFGSKGAVQLKDFKVYHGVWEEGEYVPFTDAEPFALY